MCLGVHGHTLPMWQSHHLPWLYPLYIETCSRINPVSSLKRLAPTPDISRYPDIYFLYPKAQEINRDQSKHLPLYMQSGINFQHLLLNVLQSHRSLLSLISLCVLQDPIMSHPENRAAPVPNAELTLSQLIIGWISEWINKLD